MNTTIRLATADDLPRIERLWLELTDWHFNLQPTRSFHPNPWQYRIRDFEAALLSPDTNLVILACADDNPIGMLWCALHDAPISQRIEPPRYGEIEVLTVQSEGQNQGVGTQLMKACDAWLGTQGITRTILKVVAQNEGAVSFYERHGFNPITLIMERRDRKET